MSADKYADRFKAQQPTIPGVTADPRAREKVFHTRESWTPPAWLWLAFVASILAVMMIAALWHGFSVAAKRNSTVTRMAAVPSEVSSPVVETIPVGPGPIATVTELSAPWSSKRFTFRDPETGYETPALAVRLPGRALWGISLRDDFGTCELRLVTDLSMIRDKYDFAAAHPMLVNPCTDTIYDLAQYASGPNGLVRGEIVKGHALRPPMAIELEERGDHIVAVRSE
jgi:hypothetical protein